MITKTFIHHTTCYMLFLLFYLLLAINISAAPSRLVGSELQLGQPAVDSQIIIRDTLPTDNDNLEQENKLTNNKLNEMYLSLKSDQDEDAYNFAYQHFIDSVDTPDSKGTGVLRIENSDNPDINPITVIAGPVYELDKEFTNIEEISFTHINVDSEDEFYGTSLLESSSNPNHAPYLQIIPAKNNGPLMMVGLPPEEYGNKSNTDIPFKHSAQINAYKGLHSSSLTPASPEILALQYHGGDIQIQTKEDENIMHIKSNCVGIKYNCNESTDSDTFVVNGDIKFNRLYGFGGEEDRTNYVKTGSIDLNLSVNENICNNGTNADAWTNYEEAHDLLTTEDNLNGLHLMVLISGETDTSLLNRLYAEVRLQAKLFKNAETTPIATSNISGFDHEGSGYSPKGNHLILMYYDASQVQSTDKFTIKLYTKISECINHNSLDSAAKFDFNGTATIFGVKGID